MTAGSSGGKVAELRYHPWGGTRYTYGTTPTSYQYTGQRNDTTIGLYFYNARYYDPYLNRFIQADTIVPSPANPQSLNRYAYTLNNPLRYTDPSGHIPWPIIAIFLAGVALGVNSSTPLPPGQVPPEQGFFATMMMLLPAATWYAPSTVATGGALACGDGDCTNEVTGVVNQFSQTDFSALESFGKEAAKGQAERGMSSFGDIWGLWGELASERSDIARTIYTYRVDDKIMGAMHISERSNALVIEHLEGLGGGAGTELVKFAVQESINRGFGGQITLFSTQQAMAFYEKLGFILTNSDTNEYFLTIEAANQLLQGP